MPKGGGAHGGRRVLHVGPVVVLVFHRGGQLRGRDRGRRRPALWTQRSEVTSGEAFVLDERGLVELFSGSEIGLLERRCKACRGETS